MMDTTEQIPVPVAVACTGEPTAEMRQSGVIAEGDGLVAEEEGEMIIRPGSRVRLRAGFAPMRMTGTVRALAKLAGQPAAVILWDVKGSGLGSLLRLSDLEQMAGDPEYRGR